MTFFTQNRTRKVVVIVCLLAGLAGSLLIWGSATNNYSFKIHDYDGASGDELKAALLSHVPLGSKFDDVTNFLEQNGFHEAKSKGPACGDNIYYAGSKGIGISVCNGFNFRIWEPTGWAIGFRFDDNKELYDIEIIGWP